MNEITKFWWVVAIALTVVGFFAFRAAEQNDTQYEIEKVCGTKRTDVWNNDLGDRTVNGSPIGGYETLSWYDCQDKIKEKK